VIVESTERLMFCLKVETPRTTRVPEEAERILGEEDAARCRADDLQGEAGVGSRRNQGPFGLTMTATGDGELEPGFAAPIPTFRR